MTTSAMHLDDDPINYAHAYASRGWRVLPIKPGEKRPPMKSWQEAATTEAETIDAWWTQLYRGHGVGVATGPKSGIFVLDVDVAGDKRGDETLASLENKYGQLPPTPTVITPSGGIHYYFAIPAGTEIRNDAGKRLGAGLDIRGDGGQVVAPPTMRGIDSYEWDGETWALEPAEAPRWLIKRVAELPKVESPILSQPMRPVDDGDSPAARFNARTTWAELLEADGWTLAETLDDGEQHWTRPGKDVREGISATVGHGGGDQMTVFTSAIEWLPEGSYSRFGYYACREHAGNRSEAARALRAQDYAPIYAVLDSISVVESPAAFTQTQNLEEPLDSGWEPIDLSAVLDAGYIPPRPELLLRSDGEGLLYRERINALYGESGSGKSWVAMAACVQIMKRGGHVVYIDLEDHVGSVTTRIRNLGTPVDAIKTQFHYISPLMAWNLRALEQVSDLITQYGVELVVIDSTGEAMALDGADPNSDDDVARWFRQMPRALAALGPAVLLLDHVPKAKDAPGGFAIGSQRKRAAIDGASYRVNSSVPPAKGQRGFLKLITAKDRGGHHQQGKEVATVTIEDSPLEGVTLTIDEPTPDRSTNIVVEIRAALAAHPDGMSLKSLAEEIGRSHNAVESSVKDQIASGMIIRSGSGRATRHFLAMREEEI